MNVGSLFSGIGGLDLGLERAGMTVVWQSEIDPYASRVLAKHWPTVPNLGDITLVDWSTVEPVDLICGGYPCQPFSLAGTRAGDTDPRHLWPEFARCVRHLRPRHALLENVPGHLSRGFGRVLGDLAELGYDCEWECIPAAAVGAPHLRYRVFVVAHDATRIRGRGQDRPDRRVDDVADAGSPRRRQDTGSTPGDEGPDEGWATPHDHVAAGDGQSGGAPDVVYADGASEPGGPGDAVTRPRVMVPDTDRGRRRQRDKSIGGLSVVDPDGGRWDWWAVEPDVGRVAHGIPHRVDRLRCLGNAVVPQVAEWIGRRLMDAA